MTQSVAASLPSPPRPPSRRQEWIIGLLVVPLSFLTARWQALLGAFDRWRRTRPGASSEAARRAHAERVRRVQSEVAAWARLPAERRPPIRTDRNPRSSLSVRVADKRAAHRVRMGDFRHILALDPGSPSTPGREFGSVTVEPFVTVGELTSFLLPHGLMLDATLEMEDATLGGLALSQGMTTHSHVCGLVHDTVLEFELVSGAGELVRASRSENEDVFRAAGFSHGTLGFLTALTLRVVPAQRQLLVSYRRFAHLDELHRAYREATRRPAAFFLEAILYGREHGVLIEGTPVTPDEEAALSRQGVPKNHQGRFYKPWFFSHAGEAKDGQRELMPMHDYLMRHDRSLCMTMKYVFPAGNHWLVRWLVGWMLPPKVTFLKALRPPSVRLETAQSQVYQDLAVPEEHLPELVATVERELGLYPLLVYPCRLFDHGGFLRHPGRPDDPPVEGRLYFNLGVYGVPRGVREQEPGFDSIAAVRRILAWVRERGGFQHSYCDVFQSREEFAAMFDHRLADAVRARLGSDALPTVYDKVRPEVEWQA